MERNANEVLDLLEAWERQGQGVLGVCPSHGDSHPSLKIDINAEGKVLTYCRSGCTFPQVAEALKELGLRGGLSGSWVWPEDLTGVALVGSEVTLVDGEEMAELAELVKVSNRMLEEYTALGKLGLDYIADRFGLSPAAADALKLGVTEAHGLEWRPVKRSWLAVPRLVVPFLDWEGVPRGAQARALKDHEVRWTGLANGLNGEAWAKVAYMLRDDGLDHAIITEGPSDGLTAYGAGFTAVVLRGAALSQSEVVLDELAEKLAGKVVSIVGDNDNAGIAFRDSLLRELGKRGLDVRPLLVPEEYGDLTDWREATEPEFQRLLMAAIRDGVPDTAVSTIKDPLSGGIEDATNAGVADGFLTWARENEMDVIYIRGYGAVVYADGVWSPGAEHKLRFTLHRFRAALLSFGGSLPEDKRTAKMEVAISIGRKLGQTYFRDAVLKEIASLVREVDPDDMDNREDLLLVANGVVNLRTGVLGPEDPSYLMSHRLETAYDPEAKAPRWERFLQEIMEEDQEMVDFLQRFLGYGVTGSTREQAMGIFFGHGANGKTVLFEALHDIFGPIVKTVPFNVFEGDRGSGGGASPELARLRGNRLTLTSEGEQGAPIRESLVKSMTGSDTITARHLYQEDFEFRPRHLILMATNHLPQFRGVDEGLWRRVKLVPFARYFAPAERDHYLGEKLRDEAEGILAWAVRGAAEWYGSGLREPSKVLTATANLRDNANLLAGYYPGVLVAEEGGLVTLAAAFKAWEDFAEDAAETAYSSRWLGRELESRGLVKRRGGGGKVVIEGVRLTTEAERKRTFTDPTDNGDDV
jgi:putative DNA primase/helicase